jgi:hypothetical protein
LCNLLGPFHPWRYIGPLIHRTSQRGQTSYGPIKLIDDCLWLEIDIKQSQVDVGSSWILWLRAWGQW